VQLKRLKARDQVSDEMAKALINAQWPLDKKKESASFVIDNSGSQDETLKQVKAWLNSISS
jgi:dephospho-CoA kinase